MLTSTIACYQTLGCWTPHVEITRPAFEVTLDVFQGAGLITRRHKCEDAVAAPAHRLTIEATAGEAAARQGVVRLECPSWSGGADLCRKRPPEAADDARYSATPSLCSSSVLEKRWRCSSFLMKYR